LRETFYEKFKECGKTPEDFFDEHKMPDDKSGCRGNEQAAMNRHRAELHPHLDEVEADEGDSSQHHANACTTHERF